VVVDLVPEQPQKGDIYLLCSDGLSGMMTDDDIRDVLMANGEDLEKASKALVDLANENGGEDNVTVVLLEVVEE
jgi:protein phosphatase